jgi:hypothetical protein
LSRLSGLSEPSGNGSQPAKLNATDFELELRGDTGDIISVSDEKKLEEPRDEGGLDTVLDG